MNIGGYYFIKTLYSTNSSSSYSSGKFIYASFSNTSSSAPLYYFDNLSSISTMT